jgi:hypothetical protein
MPIKTKQIVKNAKESTDDNNIDILQKALCYQDTENVRSVSSKKDKLDSSDISDIDEDQEIPDAFEEYDGEEKKVDGDDEFTDEYINTVVADRVIKYLKLDDLMKDKQTEHKKELKTIKDAKDQLEQFLIGYLDKVNEEYIQLGSKSTLTKVEKESISPPKMEDISVCLIDGFRRFEIYEDDNEIKRVVEDFLKEIEIKRERKIRKYLKRSSDDKKDKKKQNNDNGSDVKSSKRQNKKSIKVMNNIQETEEVEEAEEAEGNIDHVDQEDKSVIKSIKKTQKVKGNKKINQNKQQQKQHD